MYADTKSIGQKVVGQIKYEVSYEVTQEIVDDLMCTAFEGGVSYWCDAYRYIHPLSRVRAGHEMEFTSPKDKTVEYSHAALTRGYDIILHDCVEDVWRRFTLADYITALEEYLKDRNVSLEDLHDNHDANVEEIVQMAAFKSKEAVYG